MKLNSNANKIFQFIINDNDMAKRNFFIKLNMTLKVIQGHIR